MRPPEACRAVSVAERRTLLPGRSAWEIEQITDRVGDIALGALFVSVFCMLLFEPVRMVALVVLVVAAFPASIAIYGVRFSHSRVAAEVAAGYVTVAHPHIADVDLVHPKTGDIIRPAGGRAISPAELDRVIKLTETSA